MAANVLNSPRAVEASVYVVRAFVRQREMIASNRELATKLNELERKLTTHGHRRAHQGDARTHGAATTAW